MKPTIVVVGSANMDMVVSLHRPPRPGETVFGQSFGMFPGGKGANQAVCAAKLGAKTTFIGKLGRDILGDKLIDTMRRAGVRLNHLMIDAEARTGTAVIVVDRSGENQIVVVSGANMEVRPQDIRRHRQAFTGASVALLQLEIPLETVRTGLMAAKAAGCTVVLNPAPARALPRTLLRYVDFLTPNVTEAGMLSGVPVRNEADAERAGRKLLALGVGAVIVTMGKSGCLLVQNGAAKRFRAHKVKAVDTTGAGDAFNGAFALELARGADIDRAIERAMSVAAFSVTRMGAQASMPTRRQLTAFLRQGS